MTKKLSKEKVSNRGAPSKPDEMKVDDVTHTFVWQRKRIQDEAKVRGITEFAFQRIINDWFFTALDTARDDGSASRQFDEKFKEEVVSVDNK